MKGSVHSSDPVFIEFLPEDYNPKDVEAYHNKVFNFVCDTYEKTKLPITPRQIRECTGLGKTAVQRHLNLLVEEKLLTQRFGKFKYRGSTTITGCYEPTTAGIVSRDKN